MYDSVLVSEIKRAVDTSVVEDRTVDVTVGDVEEALRYLRSHVAGDPEWVQLSDESGVWYDVYSTTRDEGYDHWRIALRDEA